jgi:hypothetical protein
MMVNLRETVHQSRPEIWANASILHCDYALAHDVLSVWEF